MWRDLIMFKEISPPVFIITPVHKGGWCWKLSAPAGFIFVCIAEELSVQMHRGRVRRGQSGAPDRGAPTITAYSSQV